MTVDSTLAFQQRRNIPVRYNRELVSKTLVAMERVSEVRRRRERQFYRERMRGNKERELEADRKLVAENQHLLPPQYRDQVKEVLEGQQEVEGMEVEEDVLEEEALAEERKTKLKARKKLRLVRGQEPEAEQEDMEVDV